MYSRHLGQVERQTCGTERKWRPVVPGILEPAKAIDLTNDQIFAHMAEHPYYGQIHAALWLCEDNNDMLAAGLVWIFGAVLDHELPELAKSLHITPNQVTTHFETNRFLHNIGGSWQFIEGWRAYVLARTHIGEFIDAVEETFCVLALQQLRKTVQHHEQPVPTLRGGRDSKRKITKLFARMLEIIRRLSRSSSSESRSEERR